MKKAIGYSVLVLVLLIIIGAFLFGDKLTQLKDTHDAKDVQDIEHEVEDKDDFTVNAPNERIGEIFEHAAEGKVEEVSVVAGESSIEEVISNWGDPTSETIAGEGTYIDYSSEGITFGYKNHTVFDVRSFSEELQQIHFEDIIQAKGNPDAQNYYKDESTDQIILVYQVNELYQLKWILPRPTDEEPNPVVHHISVYTEVTNIVNDIPSLIDSMTLDEKIGQMMIAGIEGTTTTPETINLIEDYKIGGVIFFSKNLTAVGQTLDLVNSIKRINSSNKVPLFLSVDQEGGRITRLPGDIRELPTNQAIGLKNDPEFSYQIGKILAQELKTFGMNLNFAPVVDVNSNPNNPVIGDRSFGDDPELVSNLGIQTMKGMEDENIIPVMKHFPGHGDTSVDSHLELPKINKSLEELRQLELIPFVHAIEEGADVVMVAHILFPQLDAEFPSSMSKPIMTDLLREELNFNGVIITDDMMMDAIKNHYDTGEAAVQSVKAGSDIVLVSKEYEDIVEAFRALKQAVESGEISEARINESVTRILALKQEYGIQDKEVDYQDIQKLNESIDKVLNN
jgi:beta-N-acetylhexosaminidase